MAHFAVENLTFAYPGAKRRALDGVTFSVGRGQYVCVCGKSGCGKTTLLRHLKSALAPHGERSGRVLFDGRPLEDVGERNQAARIGFVMQDPDAQAVADKVWHELAFGLESLGVDQRTMRLRVAEMASFFGIQEWFRADVRELSGGQKQLLNLASVMAVQPSVLLLDEPTGQLDPIAAADFLDIVRKVNVELGTTVVMAEHRLEDVFATADRVLAMDGGRLAFDGAPRAVAAELYAHGDDMTCALPAPVRIFHGVEAAEGEGARADACPLTVREGRTWLAERVRDCPPGRVRLPDDAREGAGCGGASSDVALSLRDVWFRHARDGADVLRGVDLDVPRGQTLAVVGGNGAGKSTMLKCACGALRPYRGHVRLLGRRLAGWKPGELHRGGVAMVPQDPQLLFAGKTVRDDLLEMLPARGASVDGRVDELVEVAELCGVGRLLDAHPFDLSGGEQQRAALAKALLANPRVLLLDEPTKGVDGFFKRALAAIFADLKRRGVAIVMATHDVEFCARHADSVAMLFDGAVAAADTPRRFFAQSAFYTTAASRMSRGVFANAVTDEGVIELCLG